MNLIELFESKPFQDVGTFNSIFYTTPIMGFLFTDQVVIDRLTTKGRRVIVNGTELFLDLPIQMPRKKKTVEVMAKRIAAPKAILSLSRLYKELSPSEFLFYSAVKEVGNVQGLREFSTMLSLNYKTCHQVVQKLVKKSLISAEKNNEGMLIISLTQEIK